MIDKIVELICEEARRRPGNDVVVKLHNVTLEVDRRIIELMAELLEAKRNAKRNNP